jgi:dihydroorotase/N-acyl-D-amino-acid deacylase
MRKHHVVLAAALTLLASCAPPAGDFDVLILNGRIVDGTGNSWYKADIGIRGDRIEAIGKLDDRTGTLTIDAKGKVVAPGFIDMLGWSGMSILVDGRAGSKVSQGITTEVIGEGVSVAPVNEKVMQERQEFHRRYGLEDVWSDLNSYFVLLEKRGSAINIASFVGATQVRICVIGYDDRAPNDEEMARMKQLVREAMEQGALGLSTSLIYAPAIYSTTQELIELTKVAAEYGGMYISHIRDEGDDGRQVEAIYEAADIAKAAGCPVEIWHLKVAGRRNWGTMVEIVQLIRQLRDEGIDMTADVYPYIASSNDLDASLPAWAHDGGREKTLARLANPDDRKRMKTEMRAMYGGAGIPFQDIMIANVGDTALRPFEGRRLMAIATEWKKDPYDALFDLLLRDSLRTGKITFSMSEEDLRMAMAQSWTSFCTDASLKALDGPFSDGKPHPRAYGSMTRVLGRYVREEKVLTLEDAIRKMTSQPAQRVGLRDRGLLKPGFFADVVVFDPDSVIDLATFEQPHRYSRGVEHVLVNGKTVWANGAFGGNYPGRALRGPGWNQKK